MNDETKTWTVRRDGMRDLRFEGTRLADASDHSHQGDRQNRWTELYLYQLEDGRGYVLQRVFRTCWQGEEDAMQAWHCETPAAVFAHLGQEDGDGCELPELARELLVEAGEPFDALAVEVL
jgi:hypothetical protein